MAKAEILFGPFEFDVAAGELKKRGRTVKLAPKPARLLALLAGSPGQVFTREAIQRELWGQGTFVDFEQGLNFCVRRIRAALGDNARKPRYLETLSRRGYRFIGEIARPETSPPEAVSEEDRATAYVHYAKARDSLMLHGKGSLEAACEEFERAVRLDPGYAMAHSGLGAALSLRTLNRRLPEDLDKALVHLRRAVELDSEIAEPYPWLCYVHIRRSELDEAVRTGERGVALQPGLVQAHYFLGLAHMCYAERDGSHYQLAADRLLTAARVGPGWQATWFVLAYTALLCGDYESACRFARRLGANPAPGPPFIGAEIVLATVELRRGEADAARKTLSGFLGMLEASDHMYRDSMSAVARCVAGEAEMRHGTPDRALAEFRAAWSLVGEHTRIMAHRRVSARAKAGLAAAYAAAGDSARAGELLDSAIELASAAEPIQFGAAAAALPELYYSIAAACIRVGRIDQALEMLGRAWRSGWRDPAWLVRDSEFASLRRFEEFRRMVKELRALPQLRFGE